MSLLIEGLYQQAPPSRAGPEFVVLSATSGGCMATSTLQMKYGKQGVVPCGLAGTAFINHALQKLEDGNQRVASKKL